MTEASKHVLAHMQGKSYVILVTRRQGFTGH